MFATFVAAIVLWTASATAHAAVGHDPDAAPILQSVSGDSAAAPATEKLASPGLAGGAPAQTRPRLAGVHDADRDSALRVVATAQLLFLAPKTSPPQR